MYGDIREQLQQFKEQAEAQVAGQFQSARWAPLLLFVLCAGLAAYLLVITIGPEPALGLGVAGFAAGAYWGDRLGRRMLAIEQQRLAEARRTAHEQLLERGLLTLVLEPGATERLPALAAARPALAGRQGSTELTLAGRLAGLVRNYRQCCEELGIATRNPNPLVHWLRRLPGIDARLMPPAVSVFFALGLIPQLLPDTVRFSALGIVLVLYGLKEWARAAGSGHYQEAAVQLELVNILRTTEAGTDRAELLSERELLTRAVATANAESSPSEPPV